jgi:hypothetical protein
MTIAAYARERGVSRKTIWEAVQAHRIRSYDGRIDPVEADATWYRAYLMRQHARTSDPEIAGEAAAGREDETMERRSNAVMERRTAQATQMRRKVEVARNGYAERARAHVEIGATISGLHTWLAENVPADPLSRDIGAAIAGDLGNLLARSTTVLRFDE